MRGKERLLAGVMMVALIIGTAILVSGVMASPCSAEGIYCSQAFPGFCTQGACDASSGWTASGCELKCSPGVTVACMVPPPL